MNARGYTLVELMVVLAIVGFLAAVAVPLVSGPTERLQTRAAAHALADQLRVIRERAIDRGVVQRFVLRSGMAPKGISLSLRGANGNAIDFFPDGSAGGGTIVLSGAGSRRQVTVLWPSGRVAVDE